MSGQYQQAPGVHGAGQSWTYTAPQQPPQSQYPRVQPVHYGQPPAGQPQYSQVQPSYYSQSASQPQYSQQQLGQGQYAQQAAAQAQYAHQQYTQAQYAQQQAAQHASNAAQWSQQQAAQQASATTQWNQQYTTQQGYAYPGYPAQSYPTQNYNQQAYHSQGMQQQGYHQTAAVPTDSGNGCYNCGAPGHWAQSCPEPRRQNPAGAGSQPNGPPNKKFRPNYIPPVVTKYEVPDHVKQMHLASTGQTPTSFQPTPPSATPSGQFAGQQPPGKYPQTYGHSAAPPTPVSAHSPGYPPSQPWRNNIPPAPGSYASAGTTPYTPQASPYNSLGGHAVPPPPPPPPPPADNPAPHVNATNNYHSQVNGQHHASRGPQNPQDRAAASTSTVKPALRTGVTQDLDQTSLADSTEKIATSDYSEEEVDLTLLDVPDMPTEDPEKYGHKATRLISAPLMTFSATDVPNLIQGPKEGASEMIVSKFVRPNNLDTILENIRSSEHFQKKLDDPIFKFQVSDESMARRKSTSPYSPMKRPPPPSAPPRPQYGRDVNRPRQHRHEVQYKTVSNGPIEEQPRASTPVPEADPMASGGDEYDPFDPSAGLPEVMSNVKQDDAPCDDQSNGHVATGAKWAGNEPDAHPAETHNSSYGHSGRGNGISHLDRKRSYADTFPDNQESVNTKDNSFRKKRGNAAAYASRRW